MKVLSTEKEAKIIGKYLSGREISPEAVALYLKASDVQNFSPAGRDARLLSFLARFPFLIGMLDGGSALVFRNSVHRKKVFLMLAVLETRPECTSSYFCERQTTWSLVKYFFIGIRGVFRGIFGALLVKLI